MMVDIYKTIFGKVTSQSQPILGTTQQPNSAGGFVWQVDDWTRLQRFLVLGSEKGTYYISEQKLTRDNAEAVLRCIAEDGVRVVDEVVAISESGRAPKNDPALFVLAMCAAAEDEATRQAALKALPKVARIGTHLFHFMAYVETMRGWGRGLRRAVANWYNEMPAHQLSYQAIKYQQRDGWSHRDALRLAHPEAPTEAHNILYHWMVNGWQVVGDEPHPIEDVQQVWAFERAKQVQTVAEVVRLIHDFRLPWEAVSAQWLGQAAIWQALLPNLPMTALLRNLGRMTANGTLAALNEATNWVVSRLTNADAIRKARVHPLAVLVALNTYKRGGGVKSDLRWSPVAGIIDALDSCFYLSFDNVEATGKRIMLALDVSSSMGNPEIAGMTGITPRVGSAAMAMVTAQVEKKVVITAFSAGGIDYKRYGASRWPGYDAGISTLDLSPRQRLDDLVQVMTHLPFSGTDCALPMLYALDKGLEIDAFVIYTDNETWAGNVHPSQALQEYRRKMGIPAKLVVVGMAANDFSIADPADAGMMDVVGFDTVAPQLISDFIR